MTPDDVVDAVVARILAVVASRGSLITYGTFVAAEENPNYSHITIEGIPHRNIGKTASVGTLSAGNILIVVAGGPVPLTIIGKL